MEILRVISPVQGHGLWAKSWLGLNLPIWWIVEMPPTMLNGLLNGMKGLAMTTKQTAELNESIMQGRTAHITVPDQGDHDRFLVEVTAWADDCDYTEHNGGPTDIWGVTDAGDPFRVCLSVAG
jgi:hypothetical protein